MVIYIKNEITELRNISGSEVKVIGIIHSPYKTKAECPPQGNNSISEVVIFKEYEAGLQDLETFSHIHVLYWMHKSSGYSLSVVTPWDTNPHGLFAVRSPDRPNPIGYTVVELIEIDKNVLKVRGLDAIEGTPVIDIKPYIPKIDTKPDAGEGWIEGKYNPDKKRIHW